MVLVIGSFSVYSGPLTMNKMSGNPTSICLLFLGILGTGIASVYEPDNGPTLFETITKALQFNRKLAYENLTKEFPALQGSDKTEVRDPADKPFEPTPACGDQFLNLTEGSFGSITSPNYPYEYDSDLQCEWTIESIPGTVVEVTFFDVKLQPWLLGYHDYLMVSVDGSWTSYRRFAGDVNHKMPFSFISRGSRLGIRLVTSSWLNYRGFKMSYVVRGMKPSDDSPPENEYGSAFNNDLVAVCGSKPIKRDRVNDRLFNVNDLQRISYKVGNEVITRIVNGIETVAHQYPFMVAILADEQYFCGGSLIDQNHVITSASCVSDADRIDVFFGVYNMSNTAENWYSRQVRSIESQNIANNVFIHPNYGRRSGANDIAILRVNTVKITKHVQPIFLPSVYSASTSFSGWSLKTLGWGSMDSTAENLKITPVLRQATGRVITTSECREEYGGSVTGNKICTRTPLIRPPTSPTPSIESTTTAATTTTTTEASDTTTEAYTEIAESSDTTTEAYTETTEADTVSVESNESSAEKVEYESPCHGDAGAPLFAEFAENINSVGDDGSQAEDLNKAGSSSHECVNAKANGSGVSVKNPFAKDTACQRPKDSNEKWYVLVGVLSFGSTVCGTETPVVYTRVTAYLQWIAYVTGRHG